MSLVQRVTSHFDVCFTDLSKRITEGFSRCEKKIKVFADKVEAVEQSIEAVKGGKKEELKNGDDDEDSTLPDVGVSTEPSPKNKKAIDRKIGKKRRKNK